MPETRIYTHMSAKAVRGLQQLTEGRDIYLSPATTESGYTVVTTPHGIDPVRSEPQGS